MNVAIIGAGFSGLLSAYLLEKMGHKVTVFEKEEQSGGHFKTFFSGRDHWELGTVCSYSNLIKELLIELGIEYEERFLYKHFVDENYNRTEHLNREEIALLLEQVEVLKGLFTQYSDYLENQVFSQIHDDLLIPFSDFCDKHNIPTFAEFIRPFASSFGFGPLESIQAYYILKIFNLHIVNSYLQGEKLLFFKKGSAELIKKLYESILDIRYCQNITNLEEKNHGVLVETTISSDFYDKVLITALLPDSIIEDQKLNEFMTNIETNSFISSVYEVNDCDSVATYFKGNLGKKEKIQFYRIASQNNRKMLIAYAYGDDSLKTIKAIDDEIKAMGIDLKHNVTWKKWSMFPHLGGDKLANDSYSRITGNPSERKIHIIGSLVSISTLDNLYLSVKESLRNIFIEEQAFANTD